MRVLFHLLIISAITSFSYGQMNPGAKQISMSNSDAALSDDVFALFNNPAGLAQLNWREVGIYYSPAPFGLNELKNAYIAYVEPLGFGSAGIGAMTYGFELYRESKILLSFSTSYLHKFFAGVSCNYHLVSIEGYGNKGVIYLNTGCLGYLTDDLRIGFYVQNLNRASFISGEDDIPIILDAGLSYNIYYNFSLNFALEKDIRYKASIMSGINYDIIDNLSLRIGYANEPAKFSCGIGIHYSIFNFDYAVFTHPDLGLTHQAGIIISFDKEGNRTKNIREYLDIK
ncbi:MAG: hypothetical protein P4L27_02760 [Ignavibacteriaceae bacterium]|nr:hypothetical protein [Ignavibacteriaceae bacterium]